MSDKPSYLGLLNAIAVGELGGEAQFTAWAAATSNDDLRCVLHTVALREAEHARSFAKRIDELGFGVLDRPDPGLARRVAIASSTELSDCEKLRQLGFAGTEERSDGRPDIFSRFFDDTTIDPVTGALMGRYVAEERDTGRLLRACYAELSACEPAACEPEPVAAAAPQVDTAVMERLDRIEAALEVLVATTAATAEAAAIAAAPGEGGGSGGSKGKGKKKGK